MQYGIFRTCPIKKEATYLDSPFLFYMNKDFNYLESPS